MKSKRSYNQLNIDNISEKLELMGLSQIKVASELGVSRETVSKWLQNKKFPRSEKLLRLAQMLKLSFDEIVVKSTYEEEPIIAFRKKGRHKISKDYIESAKYTGSLLEQLVPYLPFDHFKVPSLMPWCHFSKSIKSLPHSSRVFSICRWQMPSTYMKSSANDRLQYYCRFLFLFQTCPEHPAVAEKNIWKRKILPRRHKRIGQ